MGPYFYQVQNISGDYAYLIRTDIEQTDEPMCVAMALLPAGTDIGTRLKWECFEYTII